MIGIKSQIYMGSHRSRDRIEEMLVNSETLLGSDNRVLESAALSQLPAQIGKNSSQLDI